MPAREQINMFRVIGAAAVTTGRSPVPVVEVGGQTLSGAACQGRLDIDWDPDAGDHDARDAAVAVCATCPVRGRCLLQHLDDQHGIVGGTNTRERGRLRALVARGIDPARLAQLSARTVTRVAGWEVAELADPPPVSDLSVEIDRLDRIGSLNASQIAVALSTTARTVQRRRAARRVEQGLPPAPRPADVHGQIAAVDTGALTVGELAHRAGCSKRAVYSYWARKRAAAAAGAGSS